MTNKNVIKAILDRLKFFLDIEPQNALKMLKSDLLKESTQLYDLENDRIELIRNLDNEQDNIKKR